MLLGNNHVFEFRNAKPKGVRQTPFLADLLASANASGSVQAPPVTQHVEELGGEHHVAIVEALPERDPDHHPVTVEIGGSQANRFRDAQAGGIAVHFGRQGFGGAGRGSDSEWAFR